MSHEADLRLMIEVAVSARLFAGQYHATENDGRRIADQVLASLRGAGLSVVREGATRNVDER